MGQVLLARELATAGVEAEVVSAGTFAMAGKAEPHVITVTRARGLDTTRHASQAVSSELLAGADLVIAMTREHVREVAEVDRSCLPRTFTLKELVRRAEAAGPRPAGETLAGYLARLHAARRPEELLGSSPDDDVADPYGRSLDIYENTYAEIEDWVSRLVPLLWKEPS